MTVQEFLSCILQFTDGSFGGVNLDNNMPNEFVSSYEGEDDMARKKYNFTLPNGESAWATGSTVSDAIANAVKRYGGYTTPRQEEKSGSVTVKEFIEKQYRPVYFATLKPKTVDSYEQFLKLNIYPFMGDMPMNEVTVRTIQEFYNWMASGSKHGRRKDLNESTITRVGGFLKKIFGVAVDMDVIASNPFKKTLLKNPGKAADHHKPLPRQEMDRIKRALPSMEGERERLYMTLLVYSGMRPEEILGMRWENISIDDPEHAYCQVARTVTYAGSSKTTTVQDSGKTKNALRTIPLPKPAVQLLQGATCKEGYVLGGETPLCYSTHKRTYEKAFEHLGIKGRFSSYDFRTTYGTELCEAGLTSKQVGDLMGHADTRMVETVYARSRQEGVMQQLPVLNKLNQAYEN